MKTPPPLSAIHRQAIQTHATALRTAWPDVPNVEERLHSETRVGSEKGDERHAEHA